MRTQPKVTSLNEEFYSRLTALMFNFMNDPAVYVTIHNGTFTFGSVVEPEAVVHIVDDVTSGTWSDQRELLRQAGRILRRATTGAHIELDIN